MLIQKKYKMLAEEPRSHWYLSFLNVFLYSSSHLPTIFSLTHTLSILLSQPHKMFGRQCLKLPALPVWNLSESTLKVENLFTFSSEQKAKSQTSHCEYGISSWFFVCVEIYNMLQCAWPCFWLKGLLVKCVEQTIFLLVFTSGFLYYCKRNVHDHDILMFVINVCIGLSEGNSFR